MDFPVIELYKAFHEFKFSRPIEESQEPDPPSQSASASSTGNQKAPPANAKSAGSKKSPAGPPPGQDDIVDKLDAKKYEFKIPAVAVYKKECEHMAANASQLPREISLEMAQKYLMIDFAANFLSPKLTEELESQKIYWSSKGRIEEKKFVYGFYDEVYRSLCV